MILRRACRNDFAAQVKIIMAGHSIWLLSTRILRAMLIIAPTRAATPLFERHTEAKCHISDFREYVSVAQRV
jgi:hypothetical protein